MKERVNIKEIIIEIIVTSIVTFFIQCIIMVTNFDSGKIEIMQSLNNSGEYIVSIGIRNFDSNEYIKDFDIEIVKNIEIKNINISTNSINYNNNLFKITQISPQTTETINFTSSKLLTNNELNIIKNGLKLRVENLNKENAIDSNTVMLILVYILISAIISFISSYLSEKQSKERERIRRKEQEIIERKIETLENKAETYKEKMEKQYQNSLYNYVEIKDLVKENDFYRKLLSDILKDNEKLSSKKLEKKITDTLKTYTTNDDFAENYEKIKFVSKKLQELETTEIK